MQSVLHVQSRQRSHLAEGGLWTQRPLWERSHLSWSLKYHKCRWAKEDISYTENLVSHVMNVESVEGGGGHRIVNFKAKIWLEQVHGRGLLS